MKNLTTQVLTEDSIAAALLQMKLLLTTKIHFTIAHKNTMDAVIDFFELDGEIAHLLGTSPTETLSSIQFSENEVTAIYTNGSYGLHLTAGTSVVFGEDEILIQLPNSADVFIFEKLPSDEYVQSHLYVNTSLNN